MAVVTSLSAPCVVTALPAAPLARGGVEVRAPVVVVETPDVEVGDSCDSPLPQSEASASKPAPKPGFAAPKTWMVVFGVVLALCAGIVDAVVFRSLEVFVSHVTGSVARVGMRIEGVTTGMNEYWDEIHSILLVASFITGSFLCGLVIPKNQVHFGGKAFYGIALMANSWLLAVAAGVAPATPVHGDDAMQPRPVLAGCLAAMACGLQNAMCTMHFGAVVRTTHVTGTATDIGSTAGRAIMILLRSGCRRRSLDEFERAELQDDAVKLCVLMPIFVGFLCGTILGALLHSAMGANALLVPAAITGSTGFMYAFPMKRHLKKLEERLIKDELDEMEAVIQRAQSRIEIARSGSSREDVDHLKSFIGQSLRVMHDVEHTIAQLCSDDALAASYRARRADRCTTV